MRSEEYPTLESQFRTPYEVIHWLTEGLERALQDLEEGRPGHARRELKGTLAGPKFCW